MSNRRIVISYVLGIILTIVLIWVYRVTQKEKSLLKSENQITKGVVIKTVNRKRGFDFEFKYWVRGRKYTNWEKIYGNTVSVGDSVMVMYYPKDPTISKTIFSNDEK